MSKDVWSCFQFLYVLESQPLPTAHWTFMSPCLGSCCSLCLKCPSPSSLVVEILLIFEAQCNFHQEVCIYWISTVCPARSPVSKLYGYRKGLELKSQQDVGLSLKEDQFRNQACDKMQFICSFNKYSLRCSFNEQLLRLLDPHIHVN
jgi:hypothetical protein